MVAHFEAPIDVRRLATAAIRCALAQVQSRDDGRIIEHYRGREVERQLSAGELKRFEDADGDLDKVSAECPMPGFQLKHKDVEVAWSVYSHANDWMNVQTRESLVKHHLGPVLSLCVNDLALCTPSLKEPDDWTDEAQVHEWRRASSGNDAAYLLPVAVANLFDDLGAYYALFDFDRPREIGFGTYYAGTRMGPFTWRRELEHQLWYEAEERRTNHVRGLYWGQYFGPRLAAKLDPDGSFVASFTAKPWPGTEIHQPIVRQFESGGLFLALSQTPLHALEHVMTPASLATVATPLHRQLRTVGLYL